jgi:hypothetical protein
MVTGTVLDNLLFLTLIILFVLIIAVSLWPPHRHSFDKLVNEQWDYEGHHYQCWQCVCGKQSSKFFPLEVEE